MTTIVNSPTPASDSNSNGMGLMFGALILIGFIAVFLFFGIPALKRIGPIQVNVPAPQVNVQAPKVDVPAPQVNVPAPEIVVPNKVDVNVTTPTK